MSAAAYPTAMDSAASPSSDPTTAVPAKETKAEARARCKAEAIARTLAAQQQQQQSAGSVDTTDAAASRSGLCEFFLARKHRLCSFPISSPAARFCAHHSSHADSGEEKVLCPFCGTAIRAKDRPHAMEADPAFARSAVPAFVTAPRPSPLDRHLLICPKRLLEISATQLPFYEKSCNGVWRTEDGVAGATTSNDASATAALAEENAGPDGHAPVSAVVSSLADVPRAELMALIDKLQTIATRLGITPESLRKIEEEQWKLLQQSRAADDTGPTLASGRDAMADESDAAIATTAASTPATTCAAPSAAPTVLSNRSRGRHNLQHAAFFRVLAQHGFEFGAAVESPSSSASTTSTSSIVAPGSVVIEVGAGKAGLSGFIAGNMVASSSPSPSTVSAAASEQTSRSTNKRAKTEAAPSPNAAAASASAIQSPPPLTLVVLDRGSFKHKADTAMRRSGSCKLLRYRVDLQDVRLERMEEVQAVQAAAAAHSATTPGARRPIAIVTGKHVCGQATDFVLRAVARANVASATPSSPASTPAHPSPAPLISLVSIATCCHHLCSWANYVNQPWMLELGLDGPRDFTRVARMTSWYTCGHLQHTEHRTAADSAPAAVAAVSDAAADPLTPALKTWIGYVCKHLLDLGRVQYLAREAGLARGAGREAYTHSSITREHFVILASA